jgi:hypothetical protein
LLIALEKSRSCISIRSQSDFQQCQTTYALRPAATCVGSLESLSDFPWWPPSRSWSFFSASALASLEVLGLLIALEQRHHVSAYAPECNRGCQNIRLEAGGNVRRVLVLLLGDFRLVVEVLVAQSLELFARVLFAFGGGVVVAEGTGEGWS